MGGFRVEMLAQRIVAAERFVCKPDLGAMFWNARVSW